MASSRGRALWACGLLLACAGGASGPREAAPSLALPSVSRDARPELLLLVSIAGLTPERYRGAAASAMPTLSALARAGVAADAVRSVAPASSYPAHATLVSGQPPAVHGIPSDRRLGDRGVRATGYWHASHLRVTTLWQLADQAQRRVAALGWPSTLGAQVALLVPDVVPTRRGETWLGVLADATSPELLAMLREVGGENPAAGYPGPVRDGVLARVACRLLAAPQPPSLLLLQLSQTAPALARYGPDSAGADAAFERSDAELARLIGCLGDAGRLERAALVAVGDHGRVPLHTVIEPNALLARSGLLRARNGEIRSWSAITRSNGGSAFVYAREEDSAVRARRALTEEAERSGVFRVVSAREMLGLGADPDAWFGLEAQAGYAFGDASSGPVQRPAASRAVGGYLPLRPEMNAGFVAWGRGFREGVRIPSMRQSDVAPTLARLLGLELEGVEGRPLIGALAPAAAVRGEALER